MKAKCLFFVSFLLLSCREDCAKLPTRFSSYSEAIEKIESSNFDFIDKADCSESSWIRKASFYSCDNSNGYFIYLADSKKYIHCKVPVNVWEGFKNAKSKGTFYNQYLKHKYQLEIE